jgi:gliding motility-associated-like protein
MRKFLRFLFVTVSIVAANNSFAQSSTGCPGVPGACGYGNTSTTNPSVLHSTNPNPQNGNGTLGNIYSASQCGLNFSTASQRLGQRFSPIGVAQPAPFVISGIPACASVLKAYLWAEGSGNGAAQTATVNGPFGSANYPMAIVGQGPDKCWGYAGSYTYRADVTPTIGGNGTYNISGLLTNPPTSGNDMDGATLIVIWADPTQTYTGNIRIDDGAIIVNGGNTSYNMTYPAICGAPTNGTAFFCIGDIQFNPNSWSANSTACALTWNWWNYVSTASPFAAGQTTSNFAVSTAGDCYNLCVTGIYYRTTCVACTPASSVTLTTSSTPATCSACNGTASVTVTPAGAYTYSWSPSGGTGSSASNLCAGTYTVTVTTSCGTSTAAVTVGTTGGSITTTGAQTNCTCNGTCNGSATVTVTSGTGPFTYAWAPSGGTGSSASGLCPGTYTCTVTGAGGCTGTQTFTITQPPAITCVPSHVNCTCNGSCNGSATVVASGGNGTYTYAWAPTGGTGSTANALCAGTYTCTISSPVGCSITQTFSITQPTAITATTSNVPATCGNSNGSVTVNPSGGTPGYTYSWNTVPVQNTQTATGLPVGTYTCTITDAALCTYTVAVSVPNTGSPAISITSFTNVTCNGACDGTINTSALGGTPPYTYAWTPAGGSTPNVTGLCPATYTCTLTDANGCTSTATQTITQPPAITITPSQVDVTCNGACNGSATVVAGGGSAPYSYNWLPSGGSGSTASSLCAGSYTCTVTDANNCSLTQTFNITEPPALTLTSAGFNVTCFGVCDGQVVVIPNGGTPGYSFLWNTGCNAANCNNICAGTYTVTVTDLNGCTATSTTTVTEPAAIVVTATAVDAHCNQSDGSVTATYSGGTGTLSPVWYNPATPGATDANIPAGNYFVVVTDQNGCDDTAFATVNNLPGVVALPGPVTNVSCNGGNNGSITVLDNGINTPYTYSWSCSASTTNTASNLSAGTCTVTLTDNAGCTSSLTTTITEPTPLTLNATATPNAVCFGSNVQLNAVAGGGTPGYQYVWMPGPMPGASQNIIPPATQTYSVYITDANNCVDSTTVNVTVNAIPVAALAGDSLSGCAPLCVNFSDLSTLASGNINQWSWDFGDGNTSTQQNPMHCYSTPGVYTVILTVTSASGCTNTITMTNYIDVFANPVAAFTANPQPTTELDPTIYFTDGSTGANQWSWTFGDTATLSSTLQNPSYTYGGPGCFQVVLTVTTNNGCIDTASQIICIDPDVTLFVPNAFTPNNDGINDFFTAKGIGLDPDKFEMWIFDRWGNMIYYTQDINAGWDGKVQGHDNVVQEDVYVWKIKAMDVMGHKHNLIGHVSVIK